MPEGHIVHRIADDLNRHFAGKSLNVESPQGRFSTDAKAVSGQRLTRALAVGKQLFLEFENDLTLRIHLGIYGKWQFHESTQLPAVVGQVRARFSHGNVYVDLRGPTVCEVIDHDTAIAVRRRLGPDPLNANPRKAESQRFIQKVCKSPSAIGLLLMNQEVISGIGNVYRAELLFRAGIEPHTPGSQLSLEQTQSLWNDSVKLMRVGAKTGFMITRDHLFNGHPSKEDRNFVYKREGQPCRKCKSPISIELMAARKLYWCAGCQR